jgi:hypothetical protein
MALYVPHETNFTSARRHEALENAIALALDQITAADARGYFAHCGYQLVVSEAHYL